MRPLENLRYRLREGKSRAAAKGWACRFIACEQTHPLTPSRKR
jgi:hypothetical protein